jgi:hypothetical protein
MKLIMKDCIIILGNNLLLKQIFEFRKRYFLFYIVIYINEL